MSFLLDTDTCSAAVRNDRRMFGRFVQYGGRMWTSRIVLVELYDWAAGGQKPQTRWDAIAKLLEDVNVLEFDDACARRCAELRRARRKKGLTVADMDVLIAATALAHDLTLVTHNTQDFENIPGLRIVDWLI